MTEEQKIKVLDVYRQLFYQDLWNLHLDMSSMDKEDLQYSVLLKKKSYIEKVIGNLTVMIMEAKRGKQ